MLKKKQYLQIIAGLFILNVIFVVVIIMKPAWLLSNNEAVATVGGEKISRQQWLNELEERYGETILKDLIDQKVIEQMAEKYDVRVKEAEIDREMTFLKTTSYVHNQNGNDENLRKQIKYTLLLEEILAKDAVVSEKEMQSYYEKNKSMYAILESFHVSQIIVKTKKEAEQTIKELKQGSSFAVLAMERSLDDFSSLQGGDIGYVNSHDQRITEEILTEIKKVKKGKWSNPVKVKEGYAIFYVHDKIPAKKYSFKEVKDLVRRQIALEQMDATASVDIFWKEAKVDWLYDNKSD